MLIGTLNGLYNKYCNYSLTFWLHDQVFFIVPNTVPGTEKVINKHFKGKEITYKNIL